MQKLKITLHSKITYIIIGLIILIELPFFINRKSTYDSSDTKFICTIDSYFINETKIDLDLSCDEKLIGYIYYNSEEELNSFVNTYNLKDKVELTGTLKEINEPTNINEFNYKNYYKTRGIFYRLKINNIKKIDDYNPIYIIYNYFFNKINGLKSKDYIYSLVFGNRKYLEEGTLDLYKKIGIMHMFSVSGMHISIIVELLNKLIKKESNRKNTFIMTVLFIYFLIVKTISLERAFISYLITYLNRKYNLEINKYLKVFLIIAIILLINPLYMFDSSFYLSVITGSVLIIISDKLNNKNIFLSTIKISIVSFFITFPLVTYIYNEINILSFIYNIITSLIITYVIFPLSLITIVFSITDNLLFLIIGLFESFINLISVFSINLVFKKEILFVFVYYIILYLIFKNKRFVAVFLLAVFIHYNINYFFMDNYIYFFDVGQGDSTLISLNHHYYLIDTGGNPRGNYYYGEKLIIPTLKSLGISHLDKLIITHGDEDHGKESIPIIENYKVDMVYLNSNDINELEESIIDTGVYYEQVKKRTIRFNNGYIHLFSINSEDENDSSIISCIDIDGYKMILTGDASKNVEPQIIKECNMKNIDILKVGHHGSKTSTSKDFVDKLKPKNAVISVGKDNRYGHPNKETIEILKGTEIYRTDEKGGLMFKIK